jgi:hypothetical protein
MRGSHRLVAVAASFVMACGTNGGGSHPTSAGAQSSHPPPPTSYRATTTTVARGVVAALPAGTLFISVSDLTAPAGTAVQSPSSAGILYVVTGAASVSGAAPAQLKAGEAAFLQLGPAQLANPGTTSSEWYFIAVQTAADRGGPPPLAGATRIFATDDLPPLPQINQAEALQRTALQGEGRSESYRPNGVEVLLGVDGTADAHTNTLTEQLNRGKAAFVLEGTVVQVLNPGSGSAAYLSFFLLPDGSPLTRSSSTQS